MRFGEDRRRERWILRATIVGLLAGAPVLPAPSGAVESAEILPLSEVRPGQTGYGLSVFAGTEPDRFEVEVLGVLRNVRPQTSYILARLSGQGLEQTGVVAGMSGSPVYLEGRLAGAVSFSWMFAEEAVAGITPIDSMRGLLASNPASGSASSAASPSLMELVTLSADRDELMAAIESLSPALPDGQVAGVLWGGGGFAGHSLALLRGALGPVASTGATDAAPAELRPGTSVAGVLIDGDFRLAATGTVTDLLPGGRVLAFGHPLLGLGPVRLPMASAEVVTVLPSAMSSFKIANLGPVVGAFQVDRQAGLRGQMGAEAPMIPMRVAVESEVRHEFELELAAIPAITPALVAISALASLDSAVQSGGSQGLDLDLRLRVAGHEPVDLEQSFDGPQAAFQAATWLLQLTTFVEQNRWEDVVLQGIHLQLQQHREPRTAQLVAAHSSSTVVRPGDRIQLGLNLNAWRGETFRHSIDLELPTGLPEGRYFLLVGDGVTLDTVRLQLERRQPISFDQALRILSSLHSRRQLVVLGLLPEAGLTVAGEVLPRLPGSLQAVWRSAASGSAQTLPVAILQQHSEELAVPLAGAVRIALEVEPRQPLEAHESTAAAEPDGDEGEDGDAQDEDGDGEADGNDDGEGAGSSTSEPGERSEESGEDA